MQESLSFRPLVSLISACTIAGPLFATLSSQQYLCEW